MILKNTLVLSLLLLSSYSFGAKLITCEDTEGNSLSYSSSSFSGLPTLSFKTANLDLHLLGRNQIYLLQENSDSYMIDAADDRNQSTKYNSVQLKILKQDLFDTTVTLLKVNGCTYKKILFNMQCTAKTVVF